MHVCERESVCVCVCTRVKLYFYIGAFTQTPHVDTCISLCMSLFPYGGGGEREYMSTVNS